MATSSKPLYSEAKPPLSISQQAELLLSRGLKEITKEELENILLNMNYYRLRGYTYPYQDKNTSVFLPETSWTDIYNDYIFDGNLRVLLFEAILYIEVALRCRLAYFYSLRYNSLWYNDDNIFYVSSDYERSIKDTEDLNKIRSSLLGEWERSKTAFKNHIKEHYDENEQPVCWVLFETATFGSLSKLFSHTKINRTKKELTFTFGLNSPQQLSNWFYNLNIVRNLCAHHSRLFSETFISTLSNYPQSARHSKPWVSVIPNKNKLYPSICAITFLLDYCAQDYDSRTKLKALLSTCNSSQLEKMGFPVSWQNEPLFN